MQPKQARLLVTVALALSALYFINQSENRSPPTVTVTISSITDHEVAKELAYEALQRNDPELTAAVQTLIRKNFIPVVVKTVVAAGNSGGAGGSRRSAPR